MKVALEIAANFAALATAIVAVWAWSSYKFKETARRRRLERYLQLVKEYEDRSPIKSGEAMRSIPHLMAHLYMTEEQVFAAAFASKMIKSWPREGKDGIAEQVMMQYNPKRRSEGEFGQRPLR